ncbi:MAG: hypothetical protein ACLQAH_15620 [Limisphaerales bacterium]
MPPPKVSTSFTVLVFSLAGLVLGFCSLGLLEVMFYTTKPFAFLEGWQLMLFVALFTASFVLIPLAAARSHALRLIWFLVAWICTTVLTGFLVSVITAAVHHQTLDIPDWMIPTGLLLVPVASGIVIIVLARFWRVRHESCA